MKALIIIPLIVAGCMAAIAISLSLAGVRVHTIDPLAAGVVASTAGALGCLPLLRSRQKDAVSIVQLALIGTVLHLLCSAALGIGLIASHAVDIHGPFIFWLLGAYWISLLALVGQLRRSILALTSGGGVSAKVQN